MPPSLTARTGFDVLSHAMKCFVSKESNSLTGLHCLKAMQLVFNHLPQAYNKGNNIKAREAMALADILAGWALTTSRVVLPHALSHAVSAFYPKAEHGLVLAALTPQNLGVEEKNLKGMVESSLTAMKGPIEANPVLVTRKEILHLFKYGME